MKNKVAAVTAAIWAAGVMSSLAAEARVAVDIASAYVFRGATFNDGLVLQPGLEASGGAFAFGVWGNLDVDDYDGAVTENEFSEIDLYGSYALPVDALDLSIGYTEYTYPGAVSEADREVSLSAGLDLPLAPSLAVFYGIDGGIEKTLYVELGAEHTFAVTESLVLEVAATLGYVNPDEGESGFSHYTAGLSAGYRCLSVGVTYVGQIDDDVLPDGPGAYDADVVGTVGLAWDL